MAKSRICSVENCGKPTKTKGLCGAHYRRFLRHGDPLKGGLPKGVARDFVNHIMPYTAPANCLIWPFGKTKAGYGVIMRNTTVFVHHIACEMRNGVRPEGMYAAHNCGNPACCNPHHLRWATPSENCYDRILHGTHNDGMNNAHCKLSDEDVAAIREMKDEVAAAVVAKRFRVTAGRINDIWANRARTALTGHSNVPYPQECYEGK